MNHEDGSTVILCSLALASVITAAIALLFELSGIFLPIWSGGVIFFILSITIIAGILLYRRRYSSIYKEKNDEL